MINQAWWGCSAEVGSAPHMPHPPWTNGTIRTCPAHDDGRGTDSTNMQFLNALGSEQTHCHFYFILLAKQSHDQAQSKRMKKYAG